MSLTVIYGQEAPPVGFSKSIFLIGPSPRAASVQSWRPEAIRILAEMGYDGVVFVPEPRGERKDDLGPDGYLNQVDWEEECMNMADIIMCWLPRDPQTMPGFTTNVELGMWIDSGKMVFGGPVGAYKNRYIEHLSNKRKVPVAHTLEDTVANALELLGDGAWRVGGEREVPLLVWRTPHFQQWYQARIAAQEVLEHARLVWTHRIGPDRRTVFFWVLWAEIYITSEDRRKSNEVVLSRPDISTIVLYHNGTDINSTNIVLVEEFRTPGGQVVAPPGGSSHHCADHLVVAAEECHEETGLQIDPERFVFHGSRQIQATLSAQLCHLYSVRLSYEELEWLRAQEAAGIVHGIEADTERTRLRITTLGEIRAANRLDWSMLGMLLEVIA
ncbi:MAG TPA: nucleoside 2-deoxyribosyltransferase domain-containing protein [Magnetospirillaceae bacterium]|nr:nucleoside 2-deoxyribosyltransferase domain-containing protein [Magnetospirillaceae bacterium]